MYQGAVCTTTHQHIQLVVKMLHWARGFFLFRAHQDFSSVLLAWNWTLQNIFPASARWENFENKKKAAESVKRVQVKLNLQAGIPSLSLLKLLPALRGGTEVHFQSAGMNNYNVGCFLAKNRKCFASLVPCMQVLSKLGSGAQGSVHLVEDKSTKELCVVKKVCNCPNFMPCQLVLLHSCQPAKTKSRTHL